MTTVMVLVVLAVLIGGLAFTFRAFRSKLTEAATSMSRLTLEGETVTGRIAATERRRKSRGQFEYFVTYAFETKDGRDIEKELRVQATRFDEYAEGQPVDIVYLPSDPSVSATREMVDQVREASVSGTR